MWYNNAVSKKSDFYISSDYAFQDESSVYLFTNENIVAYQQGLNPNRVLTVASSGDHAFESYLAGARHVDTFDINSYQRHVLELKTHMIRNLPYHEFMDFFFDNKNFFNPKIIAPISDKFSIGLQHFLIKCQNGTRNMFKYHAAISPNYDLRNLSYVSEESKYNKLRELLPERINFHHCKLERVSARFNQRYDLIMLSNIFYYMYSNETITERRFERFYHDVLYPLAHNNLTDNGKICFQYIWGAKPGVWASFLDYFQSRCIKSKSFEFSARTVISALQDSNWDTVLTMSRQPQK